MGSLLYLSTRTRPDIATAVGFLFRNSSCSTEANWFGVKRLLRYRRGTTNFGISLRTGDGIKLPSMEAYADADWAGDKMDRKSTSGMPICIAGAPVAWESRKQKSVAMSSSEEEYIALSECTKEVIWLRQLLQELCWSRKGPSVIKEDNLGAIEWGT